MATSGASEISGEGNKKEGGEEKDREEEKPRRRALGECIHKRVRWHVRAFSLLKENGNFDKCVIPAEYRNCIHIHGALRSGWGKALGKDASFFFLLLLEGAYLEQTNYGALCISFWDFQTCNYYGTVY